MSGCTWKAPKEVAGSKIIIIIICINNTKEYYPEIWYRNHFIKRNYCKGIESLPENSNFLISIFLWFDGVDLWYFKHMLFDSTELTVWNIWGLRHLV